MLVDAQEKTGEQPGRDALSLEFTTDTVEQGGSTVVTVSGLQSGEQIAATLHSNPLAITGIPKADASGTVRFVVTVPADFATGLHTLVVTSDARAPLRASLTVVAKGSLASTGGTLPWALLLGAGLLLILGSALAVRRRRREADDRP